MPRKTTPIEERFWRKVQKSDGCWIWTGAKTNGGYGKISKGRRDGTIQTHWLSWILAHGDVPEGKWILHRCDRPDCVKASHLFLGTHEENMADAVAKGRMQRGAARHNAKLDEDKVMEIRKLLSQGFKHKEIAERFGITSPLISKINTRTHWGWLA